MSELDARTQMDLDSAQALSASGKFDAALDIYQRILDANADCAETWYRKAQLHRQTGDVRLAQLALRRCIALSPHAPWPRFSLAQVLCSAGISRRWEALQLFSQAFDLDPGCAEFRLNFGNALAAAQQLSAAVRILAPLPDVLPSWWAAARDNAMIAWRSARQEARRLLAQRNRLDPDRFSVVDAVRLAHLLGALGKHKVSLSITRGIMRKHPHTWEGFATHVEVLAKADGPAAAAGFLDTIRWLFDGHPPFEVALARYRYENAENDVAWRLLTPTLRRASLDAMALTSSVLLAMDAGNLLVEHCREWIEDAPDDTAPYMFAVAAQQVLGSLRQFRECTAPSSLGPALTSSTSLIQFWDSPTPPQEVRDAMASWHERNPGLHHLVFDDESAREYILRRYGTDVAEIYGWCHHPAMKSDLFRIAHLASDGGVYVDADEYCRRPLLPLLRELDSVEFIAARSADVAPYLYNAFLLAKPGTKTITYVLQRMLDELARARKARNRPDIWHTTGPGVLTRAIGSLLVTDPEAVSRILLLTKGQYESFSEERDDMAYKSSVRGNWRLSDRTS